MSLVRNGEFLGLPVPDFPETDMVRLALFDEGRVDRYFGPEDIAEMVLARRPDIRGLIELDKDLFIEEFAPDDMPAEHVDRYCDGIEAGYEFMIGTLTYMYYMRSGSLSIGNYLSQLPKDSHVLPLRKHSQIQRVKDCLTGEAVIDKGAHEDIIDDSSELAMRDTADYLTEADRLSGLIDEEVQRMIRDLSEEDVEEVEHHVDGFHRGVENTICMYIQSREQTILNKLQALPVYNGPRHNTTD